MRKIARFPAGRNANPAPLTIAPFTMAAPIAVAGDPTRELLHCVEPEPIVATRPDAGRKAPRLRLPVIARRYCTLKATGGMQIPACGAILSCDES